MKDFQPLIPDLSPASPLLIAGPCSAESRQQILHTAEGVKKAGIPVFRAGIWKPRTHPGGFEGIGSEGLIWLQEAKERTGLLTATEVATKSHVAQAVEAGVDILWIGARTSANPFAVQEIADAIDKCGKDVGVLVKNPVNPDLELWIGALQRIYAVGLRRIAAVHRGFSTYGHDFYRNTPIWRIPLELSRRISGLPIICDPSHIGGRRDLVAPISQQAMDMGFRGLIIECHCCPDEALSDKPQQITPSELQALVSNLKVGTNRDTAENLQLLRQEIDRLDNELLEVLNRRMQLSCEIAKYKKENGMPIVQPERYDEIVKSRIHTASQMGMDAEFTRNLMASIHEESVRRQLAVYNRK